MASLSIPRDHRFYTTPRDVTILQKAKAKLESSFALGGAQIKKIVEDPLGKLYRLRVGDYRLLFELHGDEVIVLRCIHRGDLENAIRKLRRRKGL